MTSKELKPIEGAAVIVYGALAVVLPFAAALVWSCTWAAIGFIVIAAFTYVYQVYIFSLPDDWTDEDVIVARFGCVGLWLLWFIALCMLIGGY